MSAGNQKAYGHSAIVRMELYVNGLVLPIAQLGPNFLVLGNPIDHPPVDAEIGMWIDGREERWRVRLADGIKAGQRKTSISRAAGNNGSTAGA
jgi:hypothetical protein